MKSRRRIGWLILIALAVFALGIVAAPVWIIQPFRPQTSRDVLTSYLMKRWSPAVTIGALATSILTAVWLWRGSRWFAKVALVIILLPFLAATWFARQNHFEWMFHPLLHSAYTKANKANFINDGDMIIAVT